MPVDQIQELRASTGPELTIWDGSARHIADSLTAGADGIVAAPLSHLPEPFPHQDVAEVQQAIDTAQAHLDTLPTRDARTPDTISSEVRRAE
jgi:dihydrodipicolinate synthase/N-acetylneuraminate lyase